MLQDDRILNLVGSSATLLLEKTHHTAPLGWAGCIAHNVEVNAGCSEGLAFQGYVQMLFLCGENSEGRVRGKNDPLSRIHLDNACVPGLTVISPGLPGATKLLSSTIIIPRSVNSNVITSLISTRFNTDIFGLPLKLVWYLCNGGLLSLQSQQFCIACLQSVYQLSVFNLQLIKVYRREGLAQILFC